MSTPTDTISDRERAQQLLTERGVDGAEGLIRDFADEDLGAVFGAIAWFDDGQQSVRPYSTGLLVKKIKDGGLAGYRRPHERTSVEGVAGTGTDELMGRIRGLALSYSLSSTDVVRSMSREELKHLIAKTAQRLGTPADALIDSAVCPEWQWTPPHPAVLRRDGESKTAYLARYSAHVAGVRGDRRHCNPSRVRHPGESLWDFACRFWDYQLPQEVVTKAEQRAAEQAEQRKAAAEQHAADEAHRQRQLGLTEQHVEEDPADEPAPVQANLEAQADEPSQGAPDLDADPGPERDFDPVSGRVTKAGTPYGQPPARKSEAEWEQAAPRTTKESFLGADDDVTAQDLAAADRAEREKADASTNASTDAKDDEDW